ncbi:hypothetical protein FUAX_27410 [Fulvitalea axinellae]|uniref:Group III truncated hemoglobin n=1 Tax=Fulvitalea axinellae TaxID=1182444 RepID=A0AAU9D712_9BACT|nr:hypothetical protein FUAX_27410 [Fulvitalea axinellae]
MEDIKGRADVEWLVDDFYEKVRKDPLLGPIFDDVMKVDWSKHLPIMYDFWETNIFGVAKYKGRPIEAHAKVHDRAPMEQALFDRWLELFDKTIDENFEGIRATTLKKHAASIAGIMHFKVNHPGDIRMAPPKK